MSFGIEVFTGAGRKRYSTDDTSAIPPKVLFQKEINNFSEGDSGTYIYDIGVDVSRVRYAYITLVNNNYFGNTGDGSTSFGSLPAIIAELNLAASSGTTLYVDLILSDGNWRVNTLTGLDCYLWVVGK